MKKHNKTVVTYNRKVYVVVTVLLCLFFMSATLFLSHQIFATDDISFKENEKIFYKNQNPINLEQIIENNTTDILKEEMLVEEIDMEYTTKYKNNSELAKGTMQVLQEGRAGKQNAVIIKKYKNDELISEEQVAQNIIIAPVDRIVEIGTGNVYYSKVSIGDNVYVSANSASVRVLPNENSEKICTLNKEASAKVLDIKDNWYYISADGIKGYISSDCVTTKIPTKFQNSETLGESRQQLLGKLSFDMDLRNPSGMTLEQFKKVLSSDANDKNGVFSQNAEYFYYIEKQYNINGIFVASVGIHESGWGTSSISRDKKNLFGYGAVDSNPYGGAYSFVSYSEGIDLIARVFVKYYLNPNGTYIYDGSYADGKFYNGSTLSAVNSRYASDKNWANGVYRWMQYLYNKL